MAPVGLIAMSKDIAKLKTDGDKTRAERVLSDLSEALESLESESFEDMADGRLVAIRTELKDLETQVESLRKDRADPALEERIEPGERLLGLQRVKSHNKYVDEDPQTVIMRAVGRGIDYTEFVSLDAPTLASEYPDLAEIGEAEYTYLR